MDLEAWLLHKLPSGDTSLKLHLFTRDLGIVVCWCRGGRMPKKQAILQAFMPLWVSLDTRKNTIFLNKVETNAAPKLLKNQALYAAYYMNELLFYAMKPQDACASLFDAYTFTLQGLSVATELLSMEALLRKFEWELLVRCGYGLSCVEDSSPYYQFVPGKGFIPAKEGYPEAEVMAIVEGIFTDVFVLKIAKQIMRQAIHHLLDGRSLQAREFFSSLRS